MANKKISKGDHVYLIDGSGYIFRAYHALPPLTRPDGTPVGAVSGFCNMLYKLLSDTKKGDQPSHLAVILDHSGRSFRNDIYTEYKAHRPPAPDDLIPQFALIRDAIRAFNVPCIELENYEADDLIATYASQCADQGAKVTIVSSDKDMMQLIDDRIEMLDSMRNRFIGPEEVVKKFGVGPEKVIEVQALMGDSVDNVPGVKGIGEKSAGVIIREIGSLDALLGEKADVEGLRSKIQGRLEDVQASLDEVAGEKVKLNAAAQLAQILVEKLDVPASKLATDKKGNLKADTKAIENLAASGNEFCEQVLLARALNKLVSSHMDAIVEHADMALVSRELVTLKTDVPIDVPPAEFAVDEIKAESVLPFLLEQNFSTLTKRIATSLGVEDLSDVQAVADKRIAEHDSPDQESAQSSEDVMGPDIHAPIDPSVYEVVTDLAQLEKWVERARKAGEVAVDTETTSLDAMQAELVGISLSVIPGQACYIPLSHKSGEDLFDEQGANASLVQIPKADAIRALKELFEDDAVLKIGQNIKYDYVILAKEGILLNPIDDTMLLSYALDAGLHGHGMDELSEMFLSHKPIPFKEIAGTGKKQITFDLVPVDKATEYAAEDADVTGRLHRLLKPRLSEEQRASVYERMERPLVPVLADMEMAGIKVDAKKLKELSKGFEKRMAKLVEKAHDQAGEEFNLGSPKQLGSILFEKMSIPGAKKTKTGAYATGVEVLEDLAAQGHELPQTILDWRKLSKLKSTYTDALVESINPVTKRIHTSFSLASTSTGRLSSSDPNLQNIPIRTEEGRLIREAFIAEKGHKLLCADYSQIELRLLAHIANIDSLKQAFSDGLDIHAMTASEMFDVPIKDMDPMIRRQAKAINFGIIYGISAFGLARQLGIPRGQAQDYIEQYFERFPGIRHYMDETKQYVREHGLVRTIFGRVVNLPEIHSKNGARRAFVERAAINAPIQGSAADIIRRAMIRMPDALRASGSQARMLLQVHDELIFEVADDEIEVTSKVVKQVMEEACSPALEIDVPLIVDVGVADDWARAH